MVHQKGESPLVQVLRWHVLVMVIVWVRLRFNAFVRRGTPVAIAVKELARLHIHGLIHRWLSMMHITKLNVPIWVHVIKPKGNVNVEQITKGLPAKE